MTLSYFWRLMCLSGATFAAVLMIAALGVRLCAARVLRRAEAMQAPHASRLLFALRVLPGAFAAVSVVLFCIPSYLWFEPEVAAEEGRRR